MRSLLALLAASVSSLQLPAVSHRPAAIAECHRHGGLAMSASAGALQRVTHSVADVASVAAFYEKCLGVKATPLPDGNGVQLTTASGGTGLCLELVEGGTGFKPGANDGPIYEVAGGYQGLSAAVPSVAEAVAAATACGGTVVRDVATIEHAASLVPEEDDEKSNPVVEALLLDPSGCSLLVHEDSAVATPTFTGCRLNVLEWKRSQEWWEGLGWSTLRWNSNVHREASLTVTMAASPGETPAGPRGPSPPEDSVGPVVQLTYVYGCKPIKVAESGLRALTLSAKEGGDATELADPDDYKVLVA